MMVKEERDLQEKELEIIEGEFINISQSTVRNIEGGHIEMQQVGALSIDGERIEVTQGAALMVRGDNIGLNQSISGLTIGDTTSINFSFTPLSVSKGETAVHRSAAGIIAAADIRAENSSALLVLANKVEGNLTTLFDWKSALAVGAVAGGIWGLLSLVRKR
jgi:hypothetical protein